MTGFLIAAAIGLILMLACIVVAFNIRDYKEGIAYYKMEIERSDDPNEIRFWKHQLDKHYAKMNPFCRFKKKK